MAEYGYDGAINGTINGTISRNRRRRKSRRRSRRGLMSVFVVGCCAVLAVFSIGLLKNEFTFADGRPDNVGYTSSLGGAGDTAWRLIVVNKWNYIPDDYETDLTELANGQSVDKRIYPALQEMFDAARSEGVYPVVASGYRSAEQQQGLLDSKTAEYRAEGCSAEKARVKAEAWVAVPGTSEHQLGIAVDINADGIHSTGYQVYEWLSQNSYKFGFICRYPPGKTEITGSNGELWHYRYVGTRAAAEIYHQGLCLEEYVGA